MKALILLGGLGTRLRPFTLKTPKSLLPVANRPLITYQLALLKKCGIDDIVLATGYKSRDFSRVLATARSLGMKVVVSEEEKPLGTAGAIRHAARFLKGAEPFLVFNGDSLADFNLERIISFHREHHAAATICLAKVGDPSSYGLVLLDKASNVNRFIEKPKPEEIVADTINAGLYVLSSDVLAAIPGNKPVSIERETFPFLMEKGKAVCGYVHHGYWLDVGTVASFRKANFDVLEGRLAVPVPGPAVAAGTVLKGNGVVFGADVECRGRVIIGDGCFIGGKTVLEDVILFPDVSILSRSVVRKSIVGSGVSIGADCTIENSVIADGSVLNDFSRTDFV